MRRLVPSSFLPLAALTSLAAVMSCNDIPVGATTFSVKVTKSEANSKPVKVDFLWLIDNTPSMCQEQSSLAGSLDKFLDRIESFVSLDYRIGVITQDMLDEGFIGAFQAQKTTEFPFACSEQKIQACLRPGQATVTPAPKIVDMCPTTGCDCTNLGAEWTCETLDTGKKALNCNGTVNSACRRGCTSDSECDRQFVSTEAGDACKADPSKCTYKCLSPSGDPKQTGCVRRPDTAECPDTATLRDLVIQEAGGVCDNGDSCSDETPCGDGSQCTPPPVPWLTNRNARQYFKCLGIVGTVQKTEATYEQSFDAVYYALLEKGDDAPNKEQARRFMREDAYLVVVIISDEDDCSAANCGKDDKGVFRCGTDVRKEQYGSCTCLADSAHGGPLRPVSEAVNMVKSLKSDPGRVLVAVITGDSQAEDEAQRQTERALYKQSKCRQCSDKADDHPQLFNTYICASTTGKADFGGRYYDFVKAFGDNGIFTNICNDEGVGPALETIADRIIRVFTKVCLPRAIAAEETVVVRTLGPAGVCRDGSACCTEQSATCSASTVCSDGLACQPNEAVLPPGDQPDTASWRLLYSGDCESVSLEGDTPSKNAIIFNSVLPPGTGVKIDYEADYVGRN